MRFADIPGYSDIKQKLIANVRNNTLAHAILLTGDTGSWTLPLALAFSAYVHCEKPSEEDACGSCTSCSQHSKYVHPDMTYVFPVTGKPGMKPPDIHSRTFISDIRRFLVDNPFRLAEDWAPYIEAESKGLNISKEEARQLISGMSLASFTGGYRIVLIWMPEYLNGVSANALLKLFEEPGQKTLFLLASQRQEGLLSTIVSRMRQIRVRPAEIEEQVEWLQRYKSIEAEEARKMVLSGNGTISDILNTDQSKVETLPAFFREWLLACYQRRFHEVTPLIETYSKFSKNQQRALFQYGHNILNQCLYAYNGITESRFVSPASAEFVLKLAKLLNPGRIALFHQCLDDALYRIDRNANAKLSFLTISVSISEVFDR